jgi:hypothetical protein
MGVERQGVIVSAVTLEDDHSFLTIRMSLLRRIGGDLTLVQSTYAVPIYRSTTSCLTPLIQQPRPSPSSPTGPANDSARTPNYI